MNTYDPKPNTGQSKSTDTTNPAVKDGKPGRDTTQASDKDVTQKPFSPLPKDDAKPPLSAAKGSDDLMSQAPKQS